MEWRRTSPSIRDLEGHAEAYYWAKGGNFNRPIMVRANSGVNSEVSNGERNFWPELNFTFFTENYPPCIWASDLEKWPGLGWLEWMGPIFPPK